MKNKILEKIVKIANQIDFYKNPSFYLYDLDKIGSNVNNLRKNLPPNVKIYYAMKANSNKKILDYISNLIGLEGVEIASNGELNLALKYFNSDKIIFTGPAKTTQEIQEAVFNSIKYLNLESFTEAKRLEKSVSHCPSHQQDVLLRINIDYLPVGVHTNMSGLSSRLGMDESEMFKEFERINRLRGVNVKGLHVFAGSGILDSRSILNYFNYIFNLSKKIIKKGFNLDCIDLGGGLGIDYSESGKSVDVPLLGKGINKLIKDYDYSDKEIILELGRFIVGESGYYVTEIMDIKNSKGKKHIITAGGINHQRRPCAVEKNHPTEIVHMNRSKLYSDQPSVKREVVDIGGPLCLNEDILAKNIFIPKASVGDLVVIKHSGAYGLNMAAINFLKHDLPREYFLP